MINEFTLLEPETVEEAVALKAEHRANSTFVAGGTNLLYLMKRGVRSPKFLIDLKKLEILRSIEFDAGGLKIGSLATIDELSNADSVTRSYPIISECANGIASPQIRNAATVGGNLSQEVWCWYLTEGFDCWMNGGRLCYAPGGDNRYHHSVAGGYICLAVHPSDLAPVFYALDAKLHVVGLGRERDIGIGELLPGYTMIEGKLKQNTLRSDEMITKVSISPPAPNVRGAYLKFAPRGSFDFALSSVAAWVELEKSGKDTVCKNSRIVFGGVATKPYRSSSLENALRGNTITPQFLEKAAGSTKIFESEIPLSMNAYRIGISRELARRALMQACGFAAEMSVAL